MQHECEQICKDPQQPQADAASNYAYKSGTLALLYVTCFAREAREDGG